MSHHFSILATCLLIACSPARGPGDSTTDSAGSEDLSTPDDTGNEGQDTGAELDSRSPVDGNPTDSQSDTDTSLDTSPITDPPGFGFQLFPILQLSAGADFDQSKLALTYTALDDLNVSWLRIGVTWSLAEPEDDSYSFAAYDIVINELSSTDKQLLVMVGDAPQWAVANYPQPKPAAVPPDDPQDFADFLSVLAGRYQGKVAAWEIWNEPGNPPYWGGEQSAPQDYLDLLMPAYQAVKSADPQARVACGCVLLQFFEEPDYTYLDGLLALGVTDYCDVFSIHIYPRLEFMLSDFESVLATAVDKITAQRELEVWVTEVGMTSQLWYPPYTDTEDEQVAFVEAVYHASGEHRMFWFQLIDGLFNMGVLTNELDAKASYETLRQLSRE